MTRLIAYDKTSKTYVKVTLRTPVLDLTQDTLSSIPAYTHIKRSTIAGRVKFGGKGYMFERVS